MSGARRALFLDRDGVLNVDHHYIFRTDQFEVIDGVFDALRRAQALGYVLIVVTNQSGIARGYFTQAQYLELEAHMRNLFATADIHFTAIYHCPHHPEGNVAEFAFACDCRKPGPGMFLRAAREHGIDLLTSAMVGDKPSDMVAAQTAGVGRTYLIDPPGLALKDIVFD